MRLVKKEKIEVVGTVLAEHKGGLFTVQVADNYIVKAKCCGRMVLNKIRLVTGDQVTVEVSPFDLYRGRITYRL